MLTVGDKLGGHLQGGVPVLAAREVLHRQGGNLTQVAQLCVKVVDCCFFLGHFKVS
jgi:hypothetical protein